MRLSKETIAERESFVLEFFRNNPTASPEEANRQIKTKTGMAMAPNRIMELKDFVKKERSIAKPTKVEKTEKVEQKQEVIKVVKVVDDEEIRNLKAQILERDESIRALKAIVEGFKKAVREEGKYMLINIQDVEIARSVINEF